MVFLSGMQGWFNSRSMSYQQNKEHFIGIQNIFKINHPTLNKLGIEWNLKSDKIALRKKPTVYLILTVKH